MFALNGTVEFNKGTAPSILIKKDGNKENEKNKVFKYLEEDKKYVFASLNSSQNLGESLPFSKYIGPIGNAITILDGVIDLNNSIERNNKNLYYSIKEKILAAYMDWHYFKFKTGINLAVGAMLGKAAFITGGLMVGASVGVIIGVTVGLLVLCLVINFSLDYVFERLDKYHEQNKKEWFE